MKAIFTFVRSCVKTFGRDCSSTCACVYERLQCVCVYERLQCVCVYERLQCVCVYERLQCVCVYERLQCVCVYEHLQCVCVCVRTRIECTFVLQVKRLSVRQGGAGDGVGQGGVGAAGWPRRHSGVGGGHPSAVMRPPQPGSVYTVSPYCPSPACSTGPVTAQAHTGPHPALLSQGMYRGKKHATSALSAVNTQHDCTLP